MKKWLIILILIAVILVALVSCFLIQSKPKIISDNTSAVNITYENLASELAKTNLVQAIPTGESILLKIGDKSYIMSGGTITPGESNAEITIVLPAKYMQGLTNKNFCQVIQRANQNRELVFETSLSQISLAWKFKSMYNYRDCLGF